MNSCTRCHQAKEGPHFYIEPNPSFSFVSFAQKIDNLTEPTAPRPVESVCKGCLTDREIAKILAPIALFVLEAMLREVGYREQSPVLAPAVTRLKFEGGIDATRYDLNREKALKVLECVPSL